MSIFLKYFAENSHFSSNRLSPIEIKNFLAVRFLFGRKDLPCRYTLSTKAEVYEILGRQVKHGRKSIQKCGYSHLQIRPGWRFYHTMARIAGCTNSRRFFGRPDHAILGLIGRLLGPPSSRNWPKTLPPPCNLSDQRPIRPAIAIIFKGENSLCPGPFRLDHPASIRGSSGRRRIPVQTLLFSDDRGVGSIPRRKPSNRTRTSGRSARKKTGLSGSRQGTLFTLNRTGAASAREGSAA